jgi:tetraacyldisaccharide 4'-kinase
VFTIDDWREIVRRYEMLASGQKMILTTEKDAVRLVKFGKELEKIPLFAIPIEMEWLFDSEVPFSQLIRSYIENNRKTSTAA